MSDTTPPDDQPVIAGIDGSAAALHAAEWAADEALARGVPLRLVYVTKPRHTSTDDYNEDVHHGRTALQQAAVTVESRYPKLSVSTSIVGGPAGAALLALSAQAEMVCVGSVGIGRYARSILGSTASELAEKSSCPVAVIRPADDTKGHGVNWIVVAVNDDPDHTAVVDCAMHEAALRDAPVLALGDRASATAPHGLDDDVKELRRRYPGVHVYPIAERADVRHFLKKHRERVQLAVIGSTESSDLADIIGHREHPMYRHANASALVVRH
jgi:nucleotide-binding universal stress UspA family protein